nr:hypothetical protein [Mycoplasmopsis bovis]
MKKTNKVSYCHLALVVSAMSNSISSASLSNKKLKMKIINKKIKKKKKLKNYN